MALPYLIQQLIALKNKIIQTDLSTEDSTTIGSDSTVTAGVTGVLSEEHGGTGNSEGLASRATADADGNVITETYATITSVEESISDAVEEVSAAIEEVANNVSEVESSLTTRIDEVESTLTTQISEVETSLTTQISEVESTLTTQISEVETSLTTQISEVETSLTTQISEVEESTATQIAEVQETVTSAIEEVTATLESVTADTTMITDLESTEAVTFSSSNDLHIGVTGVLPIKYGGTGSSTGMNLHVDGITTEYSDSTITVKDVAINGDTSDLASTRGQIGNSQLLDDDTDLNEMLTAGKYMGLTSDTTLNFPKAISDTPWVLEVSRTDELYIHQRLYLGGETLWQRYSSDDGETWSYWSFSGGTQAGQLYLFVSKSGSDDNSGLDIHSPLLTIEKALTIARSLASENVWAPVILRVGNGDWDAITLLSLPFALYISSLEGGTFTEYSSEMPHFTKITNYNSLIYLDSVYVDDLVTEDRGVSVITEYYCRLSQITSGMGGYVYFEDSDTPVEIVSIDDQDAVFSVGHSSTISFPGSRTISVIESLDLDTAFLYCAYNGTFIGVDVDIEVADEDEDGNSITVTGKKYNLTTAARLTGVTLSWCKSLPGTTSGSVSVGVQFNGVPYGGGSSSKYLNGNLEWDDEEVVTEDELKEGLEEYLEEALAAVADVYPTVKQATYTDTSTTGAASQSGTFTAPSGGTWWCFGSYKVVSVWSSAEGSDSSHNFITPASVSGGGTIAKVSTSGTSSTSVTNYISCIRIA